MKNLTKAVILIMLIVPVVAFAAEVNYEVRRGTVVSHFGDQLVVRLASGEEKEITVPAGYKFTVDGRELGLNELTPGTELTAVIKTTKTPITVKTTRIENGEVMKVSGSHLWVKTNGQIKNFTVPSDFRFQVDGKEVGINDLRPGYKLTAEIVTTSEKTETARDIKIAGSTPPPPAPAPVAYTAPAPEPAPAPAVTHHAALPKTGSNLPLVLLLGSGMIAAGILVRRA
jgi:LPXTG-motif cell wall-anchored protein